MNLTTLLDMAADGGDDRIVLGSSRDGLSAGQLREAARNGAATLARGGASALVHIAKNGPAFPVALLAAALAGVPFVPINYRLGRAQLGALLAKHPGAYVIADEQHAGLAEEIAVGIRTPEAWLAAARTPAASGSASDPDPDSTAVIIYTSGTTSEPKGVLLRHGNLVSYVIGTVEFGSAGADESSLLCVPPYHIAAVSNVLTNLYAGRRLVLLDAFTPSAWLRLVRDERVTNAMVVPTILARIMDDGSADRSVPSLRTLAYGGAAMPPRVIERALREWPHVGFVNAYGLTETSSTVSILGPEEHREAFASADPAVRARLHSAGRPIPGVDVQVRDADGVEVPIGAPGRIWVRGEQVSGEYAGKARARDDGWFDTRDLGRLDADGFLFVEGRQDDTIIRGAENIAPAEIEDVLLRQDGVADAVAVGVPDDEWGHRIEAVVTPERDAELDPDALREAAEAALRTSKTPDRIAVWDEIPRTDTGKIQRHHVVTRLAVGDDITG
ncbi:long-chain fatty acid--CoA ligase [Saccharopolyspora sp. HNM0983]|uniref:Long-chain fatty acid--CoA ligase n=1 Tax=Saccharopolyspora montiporae TaxID=2781240 RepID=A0A929FZ11_9PSEU|nr:fatty acid--CoA ligase family protein [Saccharopolyspora sp. HNM0983]MBE9373267.1 long-chain fatty acid--CoA ligase [Saccharopolyspora sp. HNM0983]